MWSGHSGLHTATIVDKARVEHRPLGLHTVIVIDGALAPAVQNLSG